MRRAINWTRRRNLGFSLVELMVALAIGVFLIAGAISVFAKTRDLYRTNETVARLQESARYSMSVIETDLRMASYWGLHTRADVISNIRSPGEALPDEIPASLAGVINGCGQMWALDLNRYVEGADGAYGLTCPEFAATTAGDRVVLGADQLTIRRASSVRYDDPDDPTSPALAGSGDRIKLVSSRSRGTIYLDPAAPPPGYTPPLSESRDLIVRSYYVDQRSGLVAPGRAVPSLRRKTLTGNGAAPEIRDEEISPGIEDLQVEVGVDANFDGIPEVFLPLGDPGISPDNAAVALRVWLLARAENPEQGYTDTRGIPAYANRAATVPNDKFRRLLVSKTIYLRNARR